MTQPAVSNILRQLQDYYEVPLVDTVSKKLLLTEYGEILLKGFKRIDLELDHINSQISLLKGGIEGGLSIAIVSTAKYFIPTILGEFNKQYKKIKIKLHVSNRGDIIRRLEEHLDDLVIMSHPPHSMPVECKGFFTDELVIAVSKNYKKPNKSILTLKDFKDESWLVREQGSGTRFATEKIFKKHRFMPNQEIEIGDIEVIKQTIIANMGVSIISKQSIQLEINNRLIKTLPIKDFPVKHMWYFVRNKGKTLSPITKIFMDYVMQN